MYTMESTATSYRTRVQTVIMHDHDSSDHITLLEIGRTGLSFLGSLPDSIINSNHMTRSILRDLLHWSFTCHVEHPYFNFIQINLLLLPVNLMHYPHMFKKTITDGFNLSSRPIQGAPMWPYVTYFMWHWHGQ